MSETRGRGGGRRRPIRSPAARSTRISPAANRILVGLSVLFGMVIALFAAGISGVALQLAVPQVLDANVAFIVGSITVIALAAGAVAMAGTSFFRGIPFHLLGVIGPVSLGSVLEPFRELTAAGPLFYLAAWCWGFLGDSGYRLLKSRNRGASGAADGTPKP